MNYQYMYSDSIIHSLFSIYDHQIIVRRELQQVEKQINAECTLDPIVNKIHNDAAKNPMSVAK